MSSTRRDLPMADDDVILKLTSSMIQLATSLGRIQNTNVSPVKFGTELSKLNVSISRVRP